MLDFLQVVGIPRLVVQSFDIGKLLLTVGAAVKEGKAVMGVYRHVLIGCKEKHWYSEISYDFLQLQLLHLEFAHLF